MVAIDSRETAPSKSSQNMFIDKPDALLTGGLATAIHGEIAGYWAAHQISGKLSWADLFAPTIELCKNGFEVSEELKLRRWFKK